MYISLFLSLSIYIYVYIYIYCIARGGPRAELRDLPGRKGGLQHQDIYDNIIYGIRIYMVSGYIGYIYIYIYILYVI